MAKKRKTRKRRSRRNTYINAHTLTCDDMRAKKRKRRWKKHNTSVVRSRCGTALMKNDLNSFLSTVHLEKFSFHSVWTFMHKQECTVICLVNRRYWKERCRWTTMKIHSNEANIQAVLSNNMKYYGKFVYWKHLYVRTFLASSLNRTPWFGYTSGKWNIGK